VENTGLYKKIVEVSNQEIAEIRLEGQKKISAYKEETLHSLQKAYDLELEKHIRDLEIKQQLQVLDFKQELKKELLTAKQEIIDEVFMLALEKLKKLSDEELKRFVVNNLQQETLEGNETLVVNNDEYNRYARLFSSGKQGKIVLDELEKLLHKSNLNLHLDKTNDLDGGFLLIGKKFDVDFSYKTLLTYIKEHNEIEIASKLFGDN